MRRALTLLAAAAVVAAGPLRAQEDPRDRVRQAFSPEAAERILEIVDGAAEAGLPVEPLLNKALEGAAKRVPAPRVADAISGLAGRLGTAREALGAGASTGTLVAGADALRRGVNRDAIREMAERASAGRDASVALVVLGDLVELDVPVEDALATVTEALERGREGDDLFAVSAAVRRLIGQGIVPAQAATAVDRVLRGLGAPPGVPPVNLPPAAGPPGGPPVPPGAGPPGGAPAGDKPGDLPPGGRGG